jgi:hypothetical protein
MCEVPTRARKSTLRTWDKVTPVTSKVTHRALKLTLVARKATLFRRK